MIRRDLTLGAARASGADRVLDAPMPRAAGGLLIAMLAVVAFGLGWSVLAHTDRVATAEGQIVPDRRVQRIQTPEQGVIDRLLVREGDLVQAGAELVHIDRAELEADHARARAELAEVRARVLRLQAFAAALADNGAIDSAGALEAAQPFMGEPGDDWRIEPGSAVLERQARLLEAEWHAYLNALATAREELAQARARHAETEAEIAGLDELLPYLAGQRDRMQRMAEMELAPLVESDQSVQAFLERRVEHDALQRAQVRDAAAVAAAESQLKEIRARQVRDTLRELAEARERSLVLRKELQRITAQLDRRTIVTPVGGTVMDVHVHGPGEVVEPGRPMMTIVPLDSPLEVRAHVSNRDIGRVRTGERVDVKLEAFDFTRYGSMPAELVHVSRDATEHDELGRVYPILVRMERDYMTLDGERVQLLPGMDVTVDINLGQRRVIDYFLSPMLRYQHEALREP